MSVCTNNFMTVRAFLIFLDVKPAQKHDGLFTKNATICRIRFIHAGTMIMDE